MMYSSSPDLTHLQNTMNSRNQDMLTSKNMFFAMASIRTPNEGGMIREWERKKNRERERKKNSEWERKAPTNQKY